MNQNNPETLTHYAMLVAWGQFADSLGLISGLQSVSLHQKTVRHSPQTKVMEFLLAILAGLEHLQDISRSAHPLDQDQAVARSWEQAGWADYSGVSRTLAELTQAEAEQIVCVLDGVSRLMLAEEVMRALQSCGRLSYDGDLTDRPVSNTSTSYPGARYGHMGDGLQLGYQAAMVSMHSPTYGRFWLSVEQHPGDTVSCTQAAAMVKAAEAKTGFRPWRRTDLLAVRIQLLKSQSQKELGELEAAASFLEQARSRLAETQQQQCDEAQRFLELEAQYQVRERIERPYSALAKSRQRLGILKRRQQRLEKKILALEKGRFRQQEHIAAYQAEIHRLERRLEALEADNRSNPYPIQASFRLDAGFGSRENVAFLIEMGYEVYTKPCSSWLTPRLKRRVCPLTSWTRVGDNAEMVAWKAERFADFPYPVDVALERFYTGKTRRYGTLLHLGCDSVTTNLPKWFHDYNARQTIEAGIKEGKNIFSMHHLKVRTAPAIFLQEQFTIFAANFVRWAARWLNQYCLHTPAVWYDTAQPKVKAFVKTAAHMSAWVYWQDQGCLLRFTDHSLFAGRSLSTKKQWVVQLPLPFSENAHF